MEIGALLCRPVSPRCDTCPLAGDCAWRGAGHPPDHGPPRKVQGFAGTDRQCRGRLLDVLRQADGPVHIGRLQQAWHLPEQRDRALAGLIEDGLVVAVGPATYSLPE